jgi:hypothetical protein
MFNLSHKHTNGEAYFNSSNGKYKSHLVDKMDQSSSAKKDRKHRGEFVDNTEKRGGNKQNQGSGNRGKFDEIMNARTMASW